MLTEAQTEKVAAICHDANRRYCIENGDMSQPAWEDAPDWQRASAINGVIFHLHNPDAGPSGSHENWMRTKEAEGWTYGDVKDPERKTHPCMIPYEDLPFEQRMKDHLFVAIVHAFTPRVACGGD